MKACRVACRRRQQACSAPSGRRSASQCLSTLPRPRPMYLHRTWPPHSHTAYPMLQLLHCQQPMCCQFIPEPAQLCCRCRQGSLSMQRSLYTTVDSARFHPAFLTPWMHNPALQLYQCRASSLHLQQTSQQCYSRRRQYTWTALVLQISRPSWLQPSSQPSWTSRSPCNLRKSCSGPSNQLARQHLHRQLHPLIL